MRNSQTLDNAQWSRAQCSQDEAITILKTASSHRHIKLRELAEDLVASLGQSAPITAFED